jgi:hypothetical protein
MPTIKDVGQFLSLSAVDLRWFGILSLRQEPGMDPTALVIVVAASFSAGYGLRAYLATRRRRIFWT